MEVLLKAWTVINPAIIESPVSDLAAIANGAGKTFQSSLIEYAARVCYRSTAKMGQSARFNQDRLAEGHFDVTEHVWATLRIDGMRDDQMLDVIGANRYIMFERNGHESWYVSAPVRIWRDLAESIFVGDEFREKTGGVVATIAPDIFEGIDWVTPAGTTPPGVGGKWLEVDDSDRARVNLLAYSMAYGIFGLDRRVESHLAATFLFEKITRAATHQLVRHRIGSYSQESQRYVSMEKGGWEFIKPDLSYLKTQNDREFARMTLDMFEENMGDFYGDLRSAGVRKEDARALLPNGIETRIVATMPIVGWKHFLEQRTAKAAQGEIREIANKVSSSLAKVYPDHFGERALEYAGF